MKMRKKMLAVLLTAAMTMGLGGSTVMAAEAPETVKLNVAYMPNYAALWAVTTGMEKGYFEEQGIEITLYEFADGPTEIAAMDSGSIDIAYIGPGAHKLCINGQATVFNLQQIGDADLSLIHI